MQLTATELLIDAPGARGQDKMIPDRAFLSETGRKPPLAIRRRDRKFLPDACEIRGHEMFRHILKTDVLQIIPERQH